VALIVLVTVSSYVPLTVIITERRGRVSAPQPAPAAPALGGPWPLAAAALVLRSAWHVASVRALLGPPLLRRHSGGATLPPHPCLDIH
jgi:hypothetical protein